jgi:hypothetical protein
MCFSCHAQPSSFTLLVGLEGTSRLNCRRECADITLMLASWRNTGTFANNTKQPRPQLKHSAAGLSVDAGGCSRSSQACDVASGSAALVSWTVAAFPYASTCVGVSLRSSRAIAMPTDVRSSCAEYEAATGWSSPLSSISQLLS